MSNNKSQDKWIVDELGNNLVPLGKTGSDSDRDSQKHDIEGSNKKNFDQKLYFFPESYNALRKEIHDNWPTLWALVSWRMAYNAQEFVEYMNEATELNLVFDTEKVAWICDQYLTALRRMRGLSG